jgi:NCAIR mutase (PurE)-related protein
MTVVELQQLLDQVRDGLVPPTDALEQVIALMRTESFQDLGFARVDHQREFRQGFPEVVFGMGKTPAQGAHAARDQGDRRRV